MAQTLEASNGHQPTAEGGRVIPHAPPQPAREAKKQLLVQPKTHRLIRQVAERLGRSNDAVIRRAMYLLDRETGGQRVVKDDDWADEGAQP